MIVMMDTIAKTWLEVWYRQWYERTQILAWAPCMKETMKTTYTEPFRDDRNHGHEVHSRSMI